MPKKKMSAYDRLNKQAIYWEDKLKAPNLSDNEKKRFGRYLGAILKKKRAINKD